MTFAYERIVFWKKKKFIIPSGEAEKRFIDYISKPMTELLHNSPLNDIVFNLNKGGGRGDGNFTHRPPPPPPPC